MRLITNAMDVTTDTYTIQGWLKSSSGPSFEETLFYDNPSRTVTDALPGKAGLITEWTSWQKGTTADGAASQSDTYAYEYDGTRRLVGSSRYSGTSTSPLATLTEKDIAYDRNGSLLSLKRYGASSGTAAADSLSFTYTGTKRSGYSYDAHGNVTADPLSGTELAWNVIGLPMSVSDGTDTARRVYAADGTLLAVYSGSIGTEGRVRIGNFDILSSSSGALTLESAAWEGGRLLPGTGNDKILYHITDHLGSVRVVKDGTGAVRQRFDYYPFGSVSGSWSSSTNPSQPSLRYRFSGKEIAGQIVDASPVASALAGTPAAAAGTPYLDFGARLYDPRSAAWLSQDPMAEKYYYISPYAYCAGDPLNLVDPEGTDWLFQNESQQYIWFDNVVSGKDTPDGYEYVGWRDIDILRHMGFSQLVQHQEIAVFGQFPSDDKLQPVAQISFSVTVSLSPTIIYSEQESSANNIQGRVFSGLTVSISAGSNVDSLESTDFSSHVSISGKGFQAEQYLQSTTKHYIYVHNTVIKDAEMRIPSIRPFTVSVSTKWFSNTGAGRLSMGIFGTKGIVPYPPTQTTFMFN